MNRKLLVIGLDGYESSIADEMMRSGKLPALAALSQRSACLNLDHGAAIRTGLAWEHFSTGLAPIDANRWSAVHFDSQRYSCTQQDTRLPPFPQAMGCKTVVFDAPYFDIGNARNVEGIVSWGAHDPGTPLQSNPPDILNEIKSRFGDYPATDWLYGFTWPSESRTREMNNALLQGVERRTEIAKWLLAERITDWTLGIVVVGELHSAIEAHWHGMQHDHPLRKLPSAALARSGVEELYMAVDKLVASLVDECPDAGVLVLSMHGMGPNESDVASMALLPELLYRRQFGRAHLSVNNANSDPDTDLPLLSEHENWTTEIAGMFWSRHLGDRFLHSKFFNRIRNVLRVQATRLRKVVRGADTAPQTQNLDWMPASWYAKYWRNMDAFALPSFYDGQIRVNLQGREADGRVHRTDYREFCDQLEADICACTDASSDNSVVKQIIRTQRSDPTTLGPTEADLIVVWNGHPLTFRHVGFGKIGPLPYRRTGGHTGSHGMAMVATPIVKPGFYGSRCAFDIVPTIAEYTLGQSHAKFSGQSFLQDISA